MAMVLLKRISGIKISKKRGRGWKGRAKSDFTVLVSI